MRDFAKYVIASREPAPLHARIARSDASIAGSVRYIVTPSQIVNVGARRVVARGSASASGRSSIGARLEVPRDVVRRRLRAELLERRALVPCVAG